MSYTMEVNTLPSSEPEIVVRIEGPFQYITVPGGMTHSEVIQALLGFAADAGEEPALRFFDGTPDIHMAGALTGGFFGEEAMVVVMPTKRIEED